MENQILNELCFLCLSYCENLHSILSKDKNGLVIKDKLTCFLIDHMYFVPTVEKFICLPCLKSVNNIFQYRENCVQNIRILTDYLQRGVLDGGKSIKLSRTLDIINNKKRKIVDESSEVISASKVQKIDENYSEFNENDITINSALIIKVEPPEIENIDIEEKNIMDSSSSNYDSASNENCVPSSSKEKDIIDIDDESSSNDAAFEHIFIKEEKDDDFESYTSYDQLEPSNEANNDASKNRFQTNSEKDIEYMNSSRLLPKKSRQSYESTYNQFMNWRETKNIISPLDESVLLAYFEEMSDKIKPSSLYTQYSMLKSTLLTRHNVDIANFTALKSLIKKEMDGYQPKSRKSKCLTFQDINKFIQEAPDDKYLLTKVVTVIGISGSCRDKELSHLSIDDIQDLGTSVKIKIPDSRTEKPRVFTISGEFYNIYKKYAILRPSNATDKRFFLNYQQNKCLKQPLGVNGFGNLPKQIAMFLELEEPEMYCGGCFRRSADLMMKEVGVLNVKYENFLNKFSNFL